ncbi:hypothetical protein QUF63_14760, partial [Anaerolineales bacterium HSG25]|nr:hypothetical protein [Anaerolineales bacterium HSG25]
MKPITVIQFFSQQITKNRPTEPVLNDLAAQISQQWGSHDLTIYKAPESGSLFRPYYHNQPNMPPTLADQVSRLADTPRIHQLNDGLLLPLWYAESLWGGLALSPLPPVSTEPVWSLLADLLSGWLGQRHNASTEPATTITSPANSSPSYSY